MHCRQWMWSGQQARLVLFICCSRSNSFPNKWNYWDKHTITYHNSYSIANMGSYIGTNARANPGANVGTNARANVGANAASNVASNVTCC